MDTQSKQQKACQADGAYFDYSVGIFGCNILMATEGSMVEPGTYIPDSWANMFYSIMLSKSHDKELESKDKNG